MEEFETTFGEDSPLEERLEFRPAPPKAEKIKKENASERPSSHPSPRG